MFRIIFIVFALLIVIADIISLKSPKRKVPLSYIMLASLSFLSVLVLVLLWLNHINFPLNLDLMEGTVLQHVQKAANFDHIYPEPTPAYVPLAYNPLYYVIMVPFT